MQSHGQDCSNEGRAHHPEWGRGKHLSAPRAELALTAFLATSPFINKQAPSLKSKFAVKLSLCVSLLLVFQTPYNMVSMQNPLRSP